MNRGLSLLVLLACAGTVWAQEGSRNIEVVSHVAIEGGTDALAVEQDRPYIWLAPQRGGLVGLDLTLESAPVTAFETTGDAVRDLATFKIGESYYLALAMATPAVRILDITIPAEAHAAASIERDTGVNALFAYKHSSGRALLITANGGPVEVIDLEQALTGNDAPLHTLDTPAALPVAITGFDHAFAGYEPVRQQDRLYLAGAGGYYIFDITDPADAGPPLITVRSAAVQRGRMIVPMPDGAHALTLAEYRTAPVRIFALTDERVRTAAGAWMAHWQDEYAALQIRWPFAFIAAYEAGLHVVNIFDPGNPYTDAWYRTVPDADDAPLTRARRGISRVAVRNADGLIVASDLDTGFWAFRVEAFAGWHGHQWGLPNMSSAQDWEYGPDRQ